MAGALFRNTRGQTFGVADGVAFVMRPGVALDGDASAASARRAGAETVCCKHLNEVKLHENPARSVTLAVYNGVQESDLKTVRFETNDEATQRQFVDAVVAEMRPTQESRSNSVWGGLVMPLFLAAVVALIGGLVYSMASDLAGGTFEPANRVGKAGGIAKLTEGVARLLGVTGSIAVFGLMLLLCVGWAVYEVADRHAVVRWRVT